MVRIYQLKDRQAFDNTDYPSLFAGDGRALQADRVAEKDVRLRPGESVTVDMPMETSAQFVAVAAMFIDPDLTQNSWRLVPPGTNLIRRGRALSKPAKIN